MEKKILNASEAAKILGCRPQMVREHLKNSVWDFGDVIYPKDGEKKIKYIIYRDRLMRYIGAE